MGCRKFVYLNVSAAYSDSQTYKNSSLKVCEFTGCTLYLKFFFFFEENVLYSVGMKFCLEIVCPVEIGKSTAYWLVRTPSIPARVIGKST